ncbi:MAG: ADP-glyceromanno-heptose 6-epimerase [Verrucomicrobiota bacterium]|nr:ADP-glyceromanno-heptose 6-epimerase [Verrucomicrobiota bacterium]
MHDLSQGITVVTGGAGMIGSATIWGINNRGLNNIWSVDDCEPGSLKERNLLPLKIEEQIGVQEFRDWFSQDHPKLKEIKTVIHLGACSSTTESNEEYLNDNNLSYTRELCEWSLKNSVRFVYASSASTYGDGSMGMDDEDEDIEKFKPLNLYGWSKQNFDLHAKKAGWLNSIVGLKYFNVYGPNEEHKGNMRSVVSKAYEQIQKSGEMTLFKSHHPDYEDGKQMRDFLYVKDAVCITLWLAENEKANGLFNLGSGKARSWLDLAHAIFSALKMKPKIRFVEMPEILKEKYQYFTEAKIDKLDKNGFLTSFSDLEDAVKDYVTNYLVPDLRLGQYHG